MKEEWEKEFDKKFGNGKSLRFEYKSGGVVRVLDNTDYLDVKSFLFKVLSSQKKEILKEIEKMKEKYCKEDFDRRINKPYDWHGYSHAIEDIKKQLKR